MCDKEDNSNKGQFGCSDLYANLNSTIRTGNLLIRSARRFCATRDRVAFPVGDEKAQILERGRSKRPK